MVATTQTVRDMRGVLGVARQLGVPTFEVNGWESRGLGAMVPKKALAHHTAAPRDVTRLLLDGRSDVRGPLCNWEQRLSGAFGALSAGRANHAGRGIVPSSSSYGTEATGPTPLGATGPGAYPFYKVYVLSQAAICIWHGWHASNILGHKETARPVGRKPDPMFDMGNFRADISRVIATWHRGDQLEADDMFTEADRKLLQSLDAQLRNMVDPKAPSRGLRARADDIEHAEKERDATELGHLELIGRGVVELANRIAKLEERLPPPPAAQA